MKLLLDQNLSPRLCQHLAGLLSAVVHVRDVGLASASDDDVWAYAAQHEFLIVTKDADFHNRAFLFGAPPKVVWIRRGNCATSEIEAILREHHGDLVKFESDEEAALLILE